MEAEVEFFADTHEYKVRGTRWPSVTGIIKTVLGDRFSRVGSDILRAATERGRHVHNALQQIDEGTYDHDEWTEFDREWTIYWYGEGITVKSLLPYIDSYRLWRDTVGFVPLESEKQVTNWELGYCGTLDRKGLLFSRMALIDFKSGEVSIETAIQTALYALADGCIDADRYALQLIPGKIAKLIPFKDPMDYIGAKAFIGVYNWKKRNGLVSA